MSVHGQGSSRYRVLPQVNGRRLRLYPRAVDVLRRIDRQGAVLVRHPEDGKYRINGVEKRSETVIPRSLRSLLKTQAVRAVGGSPDRLAITEIGQRFLRRYSDRVVDVKGRRVMKMGVRKYEKRVQVQAVVYDGQNFSDVAEIAAGEIPTFVWDSKEACMVAQLTVGFVRPTVNVIIRDEDGQITIGNTGDFKNEFRELKQAA